MRCYRKTHLLTDYVRLRLYWHNGQFYHTSLLPHGDTADVSVAWRGYALCRVPSIVTTVLKPRCAIRHVLPVFVDGVVFVHNRLAGQRRSYEGDVYSKRLTRGQHRLPRVQLQHLREEAESSLHRAPQQIQTAPGARRL